MTLSPEEIENRTFTVRANGYDRAEVEQFLAEIARLIRNDAVTDGPDDSSIGGQVSAILERARANADEITAEAMRIRSEADAHAASVGLEPSSSGSLTVDGASPDSDAVARLEEQHAQFADLLAAEQELLRRIERAATSIESSLAEPAGRLSSIDYVPPSIDRANPDVAAAAAAAVGAQPDSASSTVTANATDAAPDQASAADATPSDELFAPAPVTGTTTPPDVEAGFELAPQMSEDLVTDKTTELLDGVLDDVMGSILGDKETP